MSANKESNLVQTYIELNKFCQSGDYERALKAAGKSKFYEYKTKRCNFCRLYYNIHNFNVFKLHSYLAVFCVNLLKNVIII